MERRDGREKWRREMRGKTRRLKKVTWDKVEECRSHLIKSFMTELAVGYRPAPGPAKVVSAKLSEFTTTLERDKRREDKLEAA
jgi:hypothetical protein